MPLIESVLTQGLPPGVALNVNFPMVSLESQIRGLKLTKQQPDKHWDFKYACDTPTTEKKEIVYKIGVEIFPITKSEEFDTSASSNGWITVCPLLIYWDASNVLKSSSIQLERWPIFAKIT